MFGIAQTCLTLLLLSATAANAGWINNNVNVPRSQPSGHHDNHCTYTCPHKDDGNFHLGSASREHSNPLFCTYPASRRHPASTEYFCEYNTRSGHLKEDHDSNLCPKTAVSHCTRKQRDLNGAPAQPRAAAVPVNKRSRIQAKQARALFEEEEEAKAEQAPEQE